MEMDLTYEVILFKIGKKSQRGYYFKESTVDKYLESEAYKNRVRNRNALGIITHYDRVNTTADKGKLIQDDVALYNKSYTHYIERLYKKDGYLIATIRFFDPELFEGNTRESIKFILGLLKSGVKLNTSAGIEAYYNPITSEGEVIYDVVGVDFTMAPDFQESGII